MMAALSLFAAGCAIGLVILVAREMAREVHLEALLVADMRQADWDAHVADALALSETPIHDQLAAEHAARIDREWAALNGADQ